MTSQTRPAILVTHPGRQHSHQAALGLERAGLLAGYWSGVPAVAEQVRRLPTLLGARLGRYARSRSIHGGCAGSRQPPPARLGDALLPARGAA